MPPKRGPLTGCAGRGIVGSMGTIWYDISRDETGRWSASCPSKGVVTHGHTADVAVERLRYGIGGMDGTGKRFDGDLRAGAEPKAPAPSETSERETSSDRPSPEPEQPSPRTSKKRRGRA